MILIFINFNIYQHLIQVGEEVLLGCSLSANGVQRVAELVGDACVHEWEHQLLVLAFFVQDFSSDVDELNKDAFLPSLVMLLQLHLNKFLFFRFLNDLASAAVTFARDTELKLHSVVDVYSLDDLPQAHSLMGYSLLALFAITKISRERWRAQQRNGSIVQPERLEDSRFCNLGSCFVFSRYRRLTSRP